MKIKDFIKIGNKKISFRSKPFIVAEISGNHGGSISNAKKLIDLAKKNGANAIKLQTYEPQALTINSRTNKFLVKTGIWKKQNLWDLYKKAQTPYSWQAKLFSYAKKKNIICFSTPFDVQGVEILENINCPIYKIASFEIDDFPLIKKIAKTNKPIIISTGTASLKEIRKSVNYIKKYSKNAQIIILYCVSSYPAKNSQFNLKNISLLIKEFKCIVGLSDHSLDNKIACASYCFGARLFEKHIKLSEQSKTVDAEFSLSPLNLKKYVNDLNELSVMLNKNFFFRSAIETKNKIYRRSIYAIQDIKKNERFTFKNVKCLRPGGGLSPIFFERLLKKKSSKNIKYGTLIKKNYIKNI